MRRVLNSLLGLSLFLFIILGVSGSAGAQQCFVEVCKSAPGAGMQGFLIDFTDSGETDTVELFDGADCFTTSLNFDADVDITEQPTPGWQLNDVQCLGTSGIEISSIPGGIVALCTSEGEASITCTFINGPAISIPTLSEWGMIAAAAVLAIVGVFFALRRRKAQAV